MHCVVELTRTPDLDTRYQFFEKKTQKKHTFERKKETSFNLALGKLKAGKIQTTLRSKTSQIE